MFLLPLQPLPGAPVVVSPESTGLLDIGTGFRDMLQTAQQQLAVDGAPDIPLPERPVLAALMADLLEGATPPEGEDSPKQIVSVLVPEAPLAEGDAVVPSDQDLLSQDAGSLVVEDVLPEEDAFSQMGKSLANGERAPKDVTPAQPVFVADAQVASPEPAVQPVLESESPEPSAQPRLEVPAHQSQSVSTPMPQHTNTPVPMPEQVEEAALPLVQSVPEQVEPRVGQEGGLEDTEASVFQSSPLAAETLDLDRDSPAPLPKQIDQDVQVPVSGFVSEQTTSQVQTADVSNMEQNLQGPNDQQNTNDQQGQDQALYSAAPPSKTQSDIPADGLTSPAQVTLDGETEMRRTGPVPVQHVMRDGEPVPSPEVQVSEDQPVVVSKPVLHTPEKSAEHNPIPSGVARAVPVALSETDVERANSVQTSPLGVSDQAGQPVVVSPAQVSETVASRLPQPPQPSQPEQAPLQQHTIRREDLSASQAPVAQPILRQDAPLDTMSENVQAVNPQQSPRILQNDHASYVPASVAQPITSSNGEFVQQNGEPVPQVVGRQNMPLASSENTQVAASEPLIQARPDMATLLSSEHNEVTQQPNSVMPRSPVSEGQTQLTPSDSDILPQLPLGMTTVQGGQGAKPLGNVSQPVAHVSASPENTSQPIVQPVVLEGDDESVLPRHPAERLSAAQVSLVSEALSPNRPEVVASAGRETLGRSQVISASETQPMNRSEFVAPLASVVTSDASSQTQEGPLSRLETTPFTQQAQPIQRDVAPARMAVQTPLAQPQQAVVQNAAVTQHVQAVATEEGVQRSVERPVANGEALSETTEARVFVAPEAQLNDNANRDQRALSQQTFAAPQTVSEQPAPFGEVVEQEVLLPNLDQNVDLETQSIERIPGRPDMRVDMTSGTTRAPSTEASLSRLNTMPSEEIDQQYRVGEQVIRNARVMTREGATQVTMRLDPQELGAVTIRLTSQDQVVSGEIAVESQKVQEIVQRNMGALREALAGQGIQLENIDVSVNDRGAQPDRETFRENLEERSGEGDRQERPRSESDRWEENEGPQRQTDDGQVDFVA